MVEHKRLLLGLLYCGKPAQHVTGEVSQRYVAELPEVIQDPDEWLRQNAPKRN